MDKRKDGESFAEYKERLREQARYLKHRLKGVMFWHSTEVTEEMDHSGDGLPEPKLKVVGRTYRKADYERS